MFVCKTGIQIEFRRLQHYYSTQSKYKQVMLLCCKFGSTSRFSNSEQVLGEEYWLKE